MTTTNNEFGKIRSVLFPIYSYELKKLVPLALIFLCISFNYALLRGLKDVYVYNTMTASSIYALKVLVIPSVVLFTIAYTFIAKRTNRDRRFNIVVSYFLGFFALFTFVLLPNCDYLKLVNFSSYLSNEFPNYCHWWDCIRVWPVSLLYIHSEVWGTLVLGVSFWTFANEIVSSIEAKRVYPFLMIGAAIGSLLSGVFMLYFSGNANLQLYIVLALICAILIIYNNLARNISSNPEAYNIEQKVKKNKVRLSFVQSIKFLLKSRYLLLLACVVLAYNMFIVFLESIWKGQVGIFSHELINNYLADHEGMLAEAKAYAKMYTTRIYGIQSICTGVLSLFWIFFVASTVSKKQWKVVALFTPLAALCASLVFFVLYTFKWSFSGIVLSFNTTPLYLIVIFGLCMLCFIKSSKYVFFDTSKERAYIPLDDESKTNGKAAIDAIGSRFAKGMSSGFISIVLIPSFGGLDKIVNVAFCFVFVLLILWIFAVYALNPEYENKLKEKNINSQKDIIVQ